jgi:Ca-activated chloride channel homolog
MAVLSLEPVLVWHLFSLLLRNASPLQIKAAIRHNFQAHKLIMKKEMAYSMVKKRFLLPLVGIAGWLCLLSFSLAAQSHSADKQVETSKPAQNKGDSALRLVTNLVNLQVSVLDRKRTPITGLEQQAFEVYEDGVRQTIELFSVSDAPASVGVIIDFSASMQRQLEQARQALAAFIQTSHPADEFFLLGFREKPQLLVDWTAGENLLTPLAFLRAEGDTALYDAISLGLEKLTEAKHAKRVLLVLSDGVDTKSRQSYSALSNALKESDSHFYLIGSAEYSGSICGKHCWFQTQNKLLDLARLTGGEAFFLRSPQQLEEIMTQIALVLRQQYSLAYMSTAGTRTGKWRKINIKVNLDGTKPVVLARKGYYDQAPIE